MTDIGRPMIALDVDGVLSPWTTEQPSPNHTRHHYPDVKADGTPVTYSAWLDPADGVWLNGLIARGIEIVWATSWIEAADGFIGPLIGLPTGLTVLPMEPETSLDFGWTSKFAEVSKAAEGRPLCWIDDLFGGKEKGWAYERTVREGLPSIIVQPFPSIGLSGRDRARIEEWASRFN
jgi:hypothetical protein